MNTSFLRKSLTKSTLVSGSVLVVFLLIIVSSCASSRSVRQQRAKKLKNTAYDNRPFTPTSQGNLLTKKLFMQNRKAKIEFPSGENTTIDPVTGAVTISEEVTFTHADNTRLNVNNSDLNVDTVYQLKEAVVTAKSTFSPEQDGAIKIDFIIDMPKELVEPVWRVTLTPKLVEGDTVIYLEPLIIKGDIFVQKQKDDYAAYDAYLNSIVDTAHYDSVFLDQDGINYDIRSRQQFYYDKYYKEWDRQIAYEKWKVDQENENEKYMAAEIGKKDELYHEYARRATEEGMRAVAYGMDTVGVWEKHMTEYRERTQNLRNNWDAHTGIKKIPDHFADIHEEGRTVDDLYNDYMTIKDSLDIAKHRYFFDLIAENELKAARIEDRKKEMIQYPFETHMRDTVIVSEPVGIHFPYTYSYPTRIGMKKVDIVLDGRIEAVDHSTYTIGASDTLSYFVASLAQLVDMSLGTKTTEKQKNAVLAHDASIKFAPNATKFDLHYQGNAKEIETIIDYYNKVRKNGGFEIDSIEVNMRTDLAGAYDKNADMADKRLASVVDYLYTNESHVIEPGVFKIVEINNGENWSLFANEVRRNSRLKNMDEIVAMFTATMNPDQVEQDIRQKYPADYKVIRDEIYPKLAYMHMVFHLYTPGMTEDVETVVEERPEYDKGLELMLDRDYDAALEIMQNYKDYNTALLLACMGYNGQSLDILDDLTPNGYTEYLKAILKLRMGNENAAVGHLREAIELDPSKAFRVKLDPEMQALVNRYNIDLGL